MQRLGQMTSKASSISMASSPSSPGKKEGESRQEDLQQGLLFRPWGLLGGGRAGTWHVQLSPPGPVRQGCSLKGRVCYGRLQ